MASVAKKKKRTDQPIKLRTFVSTSIGAILSGSYVFVGRGGADYISTYIDEIHALILFGIGVLMPLSMYLIARSVEQFAHVVRWLIYFQPIIMFCAMASVALHGSGLIGVALIWTLETFILALLGLRRFLTRPRFRLEEICIDAGLVYISVSGIWFFAYALSGSFLGFSDPLVSLTIAHFIFISLGALIIAGMMGRQLRNHGALTTSYKIAAWGTILSPAIVAIGITLTNIMNTVSSVEIVGVVCLAISYVLLAGIFLLKIRPLIERRVARWILSLSSLTLFATMGLALSYSLGRVINTPYLAIPEMVKWHGWLNALGFAGLGILGWIFVPSIAKPHKQAIPFSRLPWRWKISPQFFAEMNLIDTQKPQATGIAQDLSIYQSDTCDIDKLSPDIVAFYEHTDSFQLYVYPIWASLFKRPARLYKWFSRRVNQMNLPLEPESSENFIHSEIVPLKDSIDSRAGVRGWIRTYQTTGEAVYVAAYSQHHDGNEYYMNIAFPLPFGNLTSILALQTHTENDATLLSLSSLGKGDHDNGDQGVYFVTRLLPIRLPINETIDVYSMPYDKIPQDASYQDKAIVFARHQMWLFGVKFLTLHYFIWQ